MARRPEQEFAHVAANVRRYRQRLGLTQEELAEKAGLTARIYRRIESAEVDLRLSTLLRVARALGVRLPKLFRAAKLPRARAGRPPATRVIRVRIIDDTRPAKTIKVPITRGRKR